MSEVAFAHEAGHMLHWHDFVQNKHKGFAATVDDTPFEAFIEARDRLAQFADKAGREKLKKEFEAKFPESKDWQKLCDTAQTFRFALDINSDYLTKSYPSYANFKTDIPAKRFPQVSEVVATAYALKQTLFRDEPRLLDFMVPQLGRYIGTLEQRATKALRAKECEALGNESLTHNNHAEQMEKNLSKETNPYRD